jgi:hypothetical protein
MRSLAVAVLPALVLPAAAEGKGFPCGVAAGLQTLEPGRPVGTGIWEVVTGPVATNTYARETEEALGSAGAGTTVEALFFKPAPPRGLGLSCSATDVYSYAEVRVTATTLTVTPKDAAGRQVHEKLGAPCGPLALRAV